MIAPPAQPTYCPYGIARPHLWVHCQCGQSRELIWWAAAANHAIEIAPHHSLTDEGHVKEPLSPSPGSNFGSQRELPAGLDLAAKLKNPQRISIRHRLVTTTERHHTLAGVVCFEHHQRCLSSRHVRNYLQQRPDHIIH
jgi:hypothetical protein